jgi:26S proteasome regulatory subunit N5
LLKDGDAVATGKILVEIIDLCFEKKDFKALNENLVLLSKRRGQLKQVYHRIIKPLVNYPQSSQEEMLSTLGNQNDGEASHDLS